MRYIDETIRARLLQAQKTLYNNANPSMDIFAVRPETPIRDERLWQEVIVTPGVTATNTSVAVRKTSSRSADRAYVGYVASGTLVVKTAAMTYPVSQMNWTIVETIPNCLDVALEFDGSFVYGRNGKVEYRTDTLPKLFYTTASGQLMYGTLGGTYESIIGANVDNFDAIRGVASRFKTEDQGMIVFFVIGGILYYIQCIDGIWQSQETVTVAPANIVDVRAERTWDYRIVLQVTDASGKLYEIFTKMASSGWNDTHYISTNIASMNVHVHEINFYDRQADTDYISASLLMILADLYTESPVFYQVHNIEDAGDWGKKIWLRFDERVWNTTGNEEYFTLVDALGVTWYGQVITGAGTHELIIEFTNFNNAMNPVTLYYTPGTATGDIANLLSDSISLVLTGLVPYPTDPPELVTIENTIEWEA
jgi:hypothetical protein